MGEELRVEGAAPHPGVITPAQECIPVVELGFPVPAVWRPKPIANQLCLQIRLFPGDVLRKSLKSILDLPNHRNPLGFAMFRPQDVTFRYPFGELGLVPELGSSVLLRLS